MEDIRFPWEAAESGEVYATHQFLRELTAQAPTASWENYRLSFSTERLIVPEKHNCWQKFFGLHALCAGYVGTLKARIWFNLHGEAVPIPSVFTVICAPKHIQSGVFC